MSWVAPRIPRRVESHQRQQLVRALSDPVAAPPEQCWYSRDIFGHGSVGEESHLLDHVADVPPQLGGIDRAHILVTQQHLPAGRLH
ncbi:MAG TPA: hypothetical protein VGQ16_13230, partial [Vicinamibacterales bacterium]|nr:hypothetical protein [Vicinamibacterales bacterium]